MTRENEFAALVQRRMDEVRDHPWKNQMHLEMPFGLINDPNGLAYHQGTYYIFYQWNPNGCVHQTKHWGLTTTRDFVHYSMPRLALRPEEWYDKDGCYSGCAQEIDGVLTLFYTGNVKNACGARESYQCAARLRSDGEIEKTGVLIDRQPPGYTAHFRDPYYFQAEGNAYLLLGAQTEQRRGRALLYRRDAAGKWLPDGALKTDLEDFGYMWECPNLLALPDGKYALLFSPQGLAETALSYQNLYQSGYVIGTLDLREPRLYHGAFYELDMGFDFYAPQVFRQGERQILFGWIGMPDRDAEYPTAAAGWRYALTLPREVLYRGGKLYQQPLSELKKLRAADGVQRVDETAAAFDLPVPSACAEALVALDMKAAEAVVVEFVFGAEKMVLRYDRKSCVMTFDRTQMRQGGRGVRRFRLPVKQLLKLQVFLDRSAMELYFQDGETVATAAYFPEETDVPPKLRITASGDVHLQEYRSWALGPLMFV